MPTPLFYLGCRGKGSTLPPFSKIGMVLAEDPFDAASYFSPN